MLLVQPDFNNCAGDLPSGSFFDYKQEMSSSLAEIVDLSSSEITNSDSLVSSFPSDPKASSKPFSEKVLKKDNPFLALCKTNDTSDPVFWVPAQLHPEIAPNEFNSWIEKRASALNVNEKRATRRKSILSLHSFTSEQLLKDKERKSRYRTETPFHIPTSQNPLSPSLVRRHTYTNNQKDLLIKKEKDEFIVVPKSDTAGLKRSARAKPRRESPGKSGRRKKPDINDTELSDNTLLPHRKTVSEPLYEVDAESEEASESALLDEINNLLSVKILEDEEKTKSMKKQFSLPEKEAKNNRISLEPGLKQKINGDAPNLFEYLDAPVPEINVSPVSTAEAHLDSSSVSSEIYVSSPSTVSPPNTPVSLQSPKNEPTTRSTKKGFSWFWSSEEPEKKEPSKPVNKKKANELTPSQKSLFKKSPPGSKVSLLDSEDGASEDSVKTKSKEKPKKISLFFLSKEKSKKSKSSKENNKERQQLGQQPNLFDNSHFPLCDPCDLSPQIEQQLYRMSHQKLANPKRPLSQQVVISNLMISYLRVVNPNFRAPQNRGKNSANDRKSVPKPRSPHLISKERYKSGRHLPVDSSSDEDDDASFSDSDSEDDSLVGFGLNRNS